MLTDVKQKVAAFAEENASTLLTAGGVIGVVGTAVLTAKAAFGASVALNAEQILKAQEPDHREELLDPDAPLPQLDVKTKLKVAGPYFIPPVLTGAGTITAIIMAHRMSAQKIAALTVAYSIVERNLGDYKDKVAEKLTGPKQQAIKDELAQDAVDRNSGHERLVVVEGEVLCYDQNAGRYFNSTVEKIRQAANTTNAEVISRGYAPVSFFYEELGLPGMPWADAVGFGPENMLELHISTTLAGGRPCVTIDFVKPPQTEYGDPKNY